MASGVLAVFAESVLRGRRARGWTQQDLAGKAGVSKQTVYNIEGQRQGVGLETAALIAGAFGMKLGELADGEADHG